MSKAMWMVRSEGGELIDKFLRGAVAIGWHDIGNLGTVTARDQLRRVYEAARPDDGPG